MASASRMTRYDAIVIGLGAFGSAAAYHLAKAGSRVLAIDRDFPPHKLGSSHGETRVTRSAIGEEVEGWSGAAAGHCGRRTAAYILLDHPWPSGAVPYMQDLNRFAAGAEEDLVAIAPDYLEPHAWIGRLREAAGLAAISATAR